MRLIKVIMGSLVVVAPIATVADLFGFVAKVEGRSMQPVLNPQSEGQPNKDYVFLNRWAAKAYQFQRGEIVSFTCPNNPDDKLIKRIVGLEGDVVRTLAYKEKLVHVPDGHCWVEGDHHERSIDSNLFGPVALGLISAKVSHIIWPPARWQRLELLTPEDNRVTSFDA